MSRPTLITSLALSAVVLVPTLAQADVVFTCRCNSDCNRFRPNAVCYIEGAETRGICCPGSNGCPSDVEAGAICDTSTNPDDRDTTVDEDDTSESTGAEAQDQLDWRDGSSSDAGGGGCNCRSTAGGAPGFGWISVVFSLTAFVGLRHVRNRTRGPLG